MDREEISISTKFSKQLISLAPNLKHVSAVEIFDILGIYVSIA